jgi:hypothetical protein
MGRKFEFSYSCYFMSCTGDSLDGIAKAFGKLTKHRSYVSSANRRHPAPNVPGAPRNRAGKRSDG